MNTTLLSKRTSAASPLVGSLLLQWDAAAFTSLGFDEYPVRYSVFPLRFWTHISCVWLSLYLLSVSVQQLWDGTANLKVSWEM